MDVIGLTQKLLSFNTVNPPGNEEGIARFTGKLLSDNGFSVEFLPYERRRLQLVAEKGVSESCHPLVFTGHFDTVPYVSSLWKKDPLGGDIGDGKIWGRGSSDMKGALASVIIAVIEATSVKKLKNGIRIIFTSDEEPGCKGAEQYVRNAVNPQKAGAIIVGEPTANLPATAHKGAIYIKAESKGKTAHSSMPDKGVNAVYKAARAIVRLSELRFEAGSSSVPGHPTLNVGKITGGMNINSVPDHAEFTIDVRTTSRTDHSYIPGYIRKTLGDDAVPETLVDISPLFTPAEDPFVKLVYDVCGIGKNSPGFPLTLPYLTDGAVLQAFYNNAPTVILGPGQPEQAHQTDEFCYIDKLKRSVEIYREIIYKWNQ